MGEFSVGDHVKIFSKPSHSWNEEMNLDEHVLASGIVREIAPSFITIALDQTMPLMIFERISLRHLHKSMWEPTTRVIGYGLAHALEDSGDLPAGHWSDSYFNVPYVSIHDTKEKLAPKSLLYILDEPVDVSIFEDFCKKYIASNGKCFLQSLTLREVPVEVKDFWAVEKI